MKEDLRFSYNIIFYFLCIFLKIIKSIFTLCSQLSTRKSAATFYKNARNMTLQNLYYYYSLSVHYKIIIITSLLKARSFFNPIFVSIFLQTFEQEMIRFYEKILQMLKIESEVISTHGRYTTVFIGISLHTYRDEYNQIHQPDQVSFI